MNNIANLVDGFGMISSLFYPAIAILSGILFLKAKAILLALGATEDSIYRSNAYNVIMICQVIGVLKIVAACFSIIRTLIRIIT